MPTRAVGAPLLVAALVCAAAAPGRSDDIVQKKQAVDAQIHALQGKLGATRQGEAALRSRIAALDDRIGRLETRVGDVSAQLSSLEQDLALRRRRLADLTQLYRLQTRRLHALRRQYARALAVLNRRIVSIYEDGTPSTLDVVLGASSVEQVLGEVEFVRLISREDHQIAAQVKAAKLAMARNLAATKALRLRVIGDEHALAARAAQVNETRNALVGAKDALASQRSAQAVDLSKLSAQERALADEIAQEQAASARLQQQILAAQSHSTVTATPSSAGLIWPVNGPITSPFGPRWGSFHPGIDIGVPEGTPIEAAAAGTVIYCGWENGYGNLVVIDHGGNLATAYAHQSRIAVSCGEHVSQGQVIGYTGCTGYCLGPHLHFEVRVNGQPVDPMGYLP
jgi:murein DD-endopeptidase MepM/ murein hydrolase activator NlpD